MFYLRTIDKNEEINRAIGDDYSLVLKSQNPENFQNAVTDLFGEDAKDVECIGFVLGKCRVALYPNQHYYIVSENGKTYDNLSSRL